MGEFSLFSFSGGVIGLEELGLEKEEGERKSWRVER